MKPLKKHRSRRRRLLSGESLESRALLATLGLGVEFYEPGNLTPVSSLKAGEVYEARVKVDVPDSASGVISLPLNYSWDPKVLTLESPTLPAGPLFNNDVPNSLVAERFTLQRAMLSYNDEAFKFDANSDPANFDSFYNLSGVRGGALPNAGQGAALSSGDSIESFSSMLMFRVNSDLNAFASTTFTIALDGSMAFENGEPLDAVTGISGAVGLDLPSASQNQIVQTTIPIAIGGIKQEIDANNASGPPATPVTMILDFGNDGVFDGPNDQTVTTAADGSYQFVLNPAPAGSTYSIQEILPNGRIRLAPASGAFNFSVDADGVITPTDPDDPPLPPLDFVNQVVVIGGTKFQDLNDIGTIGVRDDTDPPMAGVTITLDINNDGPTTPDQSVVTAADGSYQFVEVPAGTHRVYEPNDNDLTFPAARSYLVTIGETSVVVDPNVLLDELDFGNREGVQITGIKRIDTNRNGAIDPGVDTPQSEVGIFLDLHNDGSVDEVDSTRATGQYLFLDVPVGTHRIFESVPDGFEQVFPATSHLVTVHPDGSVTSPTGFDFLNAEIEGLSSVAGYVYTDNDRDGLVDADEIGLPGVMIRLISNTPGVATQTTLTGPDGWYNFENVTPGTYSIEEIQPSRFGDASISLGQVLPGTATVGTTTGMNRFDGVTIAAGQNAVNYNFGETLQIITKRMLLARTNVQQEIYNNTGIDTTTVSGTVGEDVVRIEQTNTHWRVTVNGEVTLVPLSEMLIFDGLAGDDSVEVVGTSNAEEFHVGLNQLAMVTDPDSGNGLLVVGVERITADGRLGDDLLVLEGSTGVDQFSGSGDLATLAYSNGSSTVRGLSFDRVRAVNATGSSTNQATTVATDYVLQLVGDWNR
ncbi:Serine-aspartate repeat-containing protein D precursor [Rosistilla carotiformis]|uniref:Serine-aspartate repeat-containing protein D n=1 Tax=Rosistilla carotiformis TaxID=2528017 RepID=A0A518JY26_9BACT|nr:SdrD B-like domain-containing protein [Rosistilla carotiformis]QDV70441.1 Serine-aspartate repeat-containing protein D precursor [Rosistilla carotiformis]